MQQVLTIKLKILPDEAGKKLLPSFPDVCQCDQDCYSVLQVHKYIKGEASIQVLKEEAEQPDRPPFPGAPGQPCLEQGLFPCVGQVTYTAALQREHPRGKDPCPIQGRCLRVGF